MRQSRRFVLISGVKFFSTDFTYTGTYTWVDDGSGNWRLKFLTSGTFTPWKTITIDLFLVGGGAGGGDSNGYADGAGGGGGRTGQWNSIVLVAGTAYSITVGAGTPCYSAGGASSFIGGSVNNSVNGGSAIVTHYVGSSGGSGGASGSDTSSGYGAAGGSNGGNGGAGSSAGGAGQGTTTHEFGDSLLPLYGGGGGAGAWGGTGGAGGAGGGGNGASGYSQSGGYGTANTGGGGGGASRGQTTSSSGGLGGHGGSGIVIIRNKR